MEKQFTTLNKFRVREQKKAVLSLILGSISLGSVLILYGIGFAIFKLGLMGRTPGMGGILMGLLLSALLSGIAGLILGIFGLKSPKNNFAIVGIILCLIGLIVPLYYFFK